MSPLAQPFAATTSGAILVPMIVALLLGLIGYIVRRGGQLLDQMRTNREVLDDIKRETKTNSGTSLRDAVVRIESRVDAIANGLDQHLEDGRLQLERIDRALERRERPKRRGGPDGTPAADS